MYRIRGIIGHIFMRLCSLFPIENKIVFISFYGKSFSDSPKAIYRKLKEEKIEAKYVWLMNDNTIQIPGAAVIKSSTFKALYHLATAKIWIDNSRKSGWVVKRRGQYYIQTWHAGITMKKLEKDAVDKLSDGYIKGAKHDSEMADILVSGSRWNTENYRQSFWYTGEILESGLPRSDVFFENSNIAKEVRRQYHIGENEKIVLYAPTFRVDGKTECYNMDFPAVINALEQKWEGTWKMLIKLHPNVSMKRNEINYSQNVIDASNNTDISELLIACDVLITDYSSCMFDALNIHKKVLLYASDIEEYYQDRGTYFSFAELPFLLATNNNEMLHIISDFDEGNYISKIGSFKKKYKIFDDGHASERVVKKIRSVLAG